MTQLVGRILRQPWAAKTKVPDLDAGYVITHHAATADVVGRIKTGLEKDGLADLVVLVNAANGAAGSGMGARQLPRRDKYSDTKIYLPKVLYVTDGTTRDLDYDADVAALIDWSDFDPKEIAQRIPDNPEKRIYAFHELHKLQTGYELFIPHALFAMLASPDLGGIIPHEGEVFTAKDMKTARKFGKTWVMGAQKSHLTIRIGPHAIAHMRERQARLEFERQQQEQRNGPVLHWVSEHERRYRSGKVVWIKRHYRGAGNLPTRVMGPSNGRVWI